MKSVVVLQNRSKSNLNILLQLQNQYTLTHGKFLVQPLRWNQQVFR